MEWKGVSRFNNFELKVYKIIGIYQFQKIILFFEKTNNGPHLFENTLIFPLLSRSKFELDVHVFECDVDVIRSFVPSIKIQRNRRLFPLLEENGLRLAWSKVIFTPLTLELKMHLMIGLRL